MGKEYILPNIYNTEENYNVFMEKKKTYTLHEIMQEKCSFILARPGYGKSRLLEELDHTIRESNELSYLIDLKKIINFEVDNFLELCLGRDYKNITKALELNDNVTILMDSLDELSKSKVLETYDLVSTLILMYPNIKIIISSRTGHFEKYKIFLKSRIYTTFEIDKFTQQQLNDYLLKDNVQNESINKIVKLNSNSIYIPRYLGYIVEIAKANPEKLMNINKRNEILELIIRTHIDRLDSEKNGYTKLEGIGTLTVLSNIALSMEINQTKEITGEEIFDFFENIDSTICNRFFYKNSLSALCDDTVFRYSDGLYQFENSEIQEFLAARLLLKTSNVRKILFELVTNNSSHEIGIAWFNTLAFILESKPKLYMDIVKYIGSKRKSYNLDAYNLITSTDLSFFNRTELDYIFFNIYEHYQEYGIWLDYGLLNSLIEIANENLLIKLMGNLNLKDSSDKRDFRFGNFLAVYRHYIDRNDIKDISKATLEKLYKICVKLIKSTKHTVVQRKAIPIIGELKQVEIIEALLEDIDTEDELIHSSILSTCSKNYPNEIFSIRMYLKAMNHRSNRTFEIIEGISKISKNTSLQYLLNALIADEDITWTIFDITRKRDYGRVSNISLVEKLNYETMEILREFLIAVLDKSIGKFYNAKHSEFLLSLLTIYDTSSNNGVLELIKELKHVKEYKNPVSLYGHILIHLSVCNNIELIIDWLASFGKEHFQVRSYLNEMNYYKHEEYLAARDYAKNKYGIIHVQMGHVDKKENEFYKEFINLLVHDKDKYFLSVFNYYCNNKKEIDLEIKKEDEERLLKLAKKHLGELDPSKMKVISTGEKTYSVSSGMDVFGDCLRVCDLNGIDLSEYRRKMIKFIPLAQYEVIPILVKWIGYFKSGEEEDFVQDIVCSCDARAFYNTNSIIRFINEINFETNGFIDLLDYFMKHEKISEHHKADILKIINNKQIDEEYMLNIYDNDDGIIKNEAAKILIKYYKNDSIIKARFSDLDEYKVKYKRTSGMHNVGKAESEYLDMYFVEPLLYVDETYQIEFLKLLEESFKLYQEHDHYYEYCRYLWSAIEKYYIYHISINPDFDLGQLIGLVDEYQDEGAVLFSYTLNKLTTEVIKERARSKSYISCVQYLNDKLRIDSTITSSDLLIKTTMDVINDDLTNWIENEGAYRMINDLSGKQEDLIQKTIISQLKFGFLKRGLDVEIYREVQLIDDKRLDIVVSYGFVGRVAIELKRLDNKDIVRSNIKPYLKKLEQYKKGVEADYLIFLIFKINNIRKKLSQKVDIITNSCKELGLTKINTVGIDCILMDDVD